MTTESFAWVTLTTNEQYALGALVLAASLKEQKTKAKLVCLITPQNLSQLMVDALKNIFDEVVDVALLNSNEEKMLNLMQRPELGVTLTKIHCWKLTNYDKCVFLDADTLVLGNCDELFDLPELSAAPDIGWPDCFNSGMFVFKPNVERYRDLLAFLNENKSFDGGDQGVLNDFFKNWNHLKFTYNTAISSVYSYLPAFKKYEKDIKILHFLGPIKPWNLNFDHKTCKLLSVPPHYKYSSEYLVKWWKLFLECSRQFGLNHDEKFSQSTRTKPSLEAWQLNDIDYSGVDSFDNILLHIEATLKQERKTENINTRLSSQNFTNAKTYETITKLSQVQNLKTPVNGQKHTKTWPKPGTYEAWDQGEIDYLGVDAFDKIITYIYERMSKSKLEKIQKYPYIEQLV